MKKSMIWKLLGAVLLAAAALSAGAEKLDKPLPFDPLVKVGRLPNGLTYYIRRNDRPAKRVVLRLVVKAGSILEDNDQQGLAHFTEHMAFDGTRHFKKHDLISYLQTLGVQFGADLNAYTSFNQTVFMLPIPTDKPGNLETGFQVLEDWAQGVTEDTAAIEKERNVVLEEARLGKGAQDRIMRKLMPAEYNGSRYAERLPIGKENILRHFKPSTLRRFYADWYRPDLEAVIVVGDIDPARAEKMVRKYFSHLKNPAHERKRFYAPIPARSNTNAVVATDPEADMNMVMIRYPVEKHHAEVTLNDYRNSLVRELFEAMLNQRLQDLTMQANPPFIGASSGEDDMAPGYRAFTSTAYLGHAGAAPAITALIRENKRARRYGFSKDELARAKMQLHRSMETAYNERDKTNSNSYVEEYTRNFLVQEPSPGIKREYAYVNEMLPGITLKEINAYARQVTPPHAPLLIAYMGSSKRSEGIPSRHELVRLAEKAEAAPVAPLKQGAAATSLMSRPAKAASIVSEKHDAALGTTEWVLSNGVKVVLKPTSFKNDQVLLGALRFGGNSLYGQAELYNARYATAVDYSTGLGKFSPIQLDRILSGKSADLNTSLDNYTESINGVSSQADIETMFQQLYLRMQAPRVDKTLFRAFIQSSEDMARDALSNPDAQFSDAVKRALFNNNPRLTLTPRPQDFHHVSMKRALAIYHQRFGSARGFTFYIVGGFDPDKIKPLVTAYLGNLPMGKIAVGYKDRGVRPVKGVVKKVVHAGLEPRSRVIVVFTGDAAFSRERARRLRLLMGVMNNRIIDTLREKMSLIYNGGMSGALLRTPYQNYRVITELPCGPENVKKVEAALFDVIRKMQQDGPSKADMEKAKQGWLKSHQVAVRTNGYWLNVLQEAGLHGTDPAAVLDDEKEMAAITPLQLRDAARRYLNLNNYLLAELYPARAAGK